MQLREPQPIAALSARQAFTLIEIMIVIGIIAVVMTAGIPTIGRALQRDDLARAIHDTIEGCKTARDRAILQGVPWVFIIKANGQIDVQAAPSERRINAPAAGPKGSDGAPYSGFPRQLGEDVMIQLISVNFVELMEAPEARVRFFPNGTCDEFTVVFAWLGRQRSVTLDIITGNALEVQRDAFGNLQTK